MPFSAAAIRAISTTTVSLRIMFHQVRENSLQDTELLDKAMRANNGAKFLNCGPGIGPDTTLRARATLLFAQYWLSGPENDVTRIDALFRQSGLLQE